jgi:hypothetical protein
MTTAILCSLTLGAAAQTGIRLDLETVDPRGSSGQERIELQGNKLRLDHFSQTATGSGGVNHAPTSSIVFDGSQMYSVNHRTKTYTAVDPTRTSKQEAYPAQVAFKKGSGNDHVAGFACTNYTELRNGAEWGTVCLASWKTGPVKKDDLTGLVKFSGSLAAVEPSIGVIVVNPADWPGFPLSSQSSDGHIVRVRDAERANIPGNEFQPSSEYTRQSVAQ